jgi:plasmid stabilization system protein ParE
MNLQFHPAVQKDVNRILAYYRKEGGPALESRFYDDLMVVLQAVADYPQRFSPYPPNQRFRRAFIKRFHHVVIFRMKGSLPRITVIKHERRHPRVGMSRW